MWVFFFKSQFRLYYYYYYCIPVQYYKEKYAKFS